MGLKDFFAKLFGQSQDAAMTTPVEPMTAVPPSEPQAQAPAPVATPPQTAPEIQVPPAPAQTQDAGRMPIEAVENMPESEMPASTPPAEENTSK